MYSSIRTESTILALYRNVRVRGNSYSSTFYAVAAQAHISNYARNKKLINTKRLTFFIISVCYSHKMNGNLFAFSCIDICSELRLNAAFCIIVRDEPFVWFMCFLSLIFT